MSQDTFRQIIRLTEQLSASERAALIQHLQDQSNDRVNEGITLKEIEREHERRRAAGEFAETISLMGKYARPGLDLSFDNLQASINEAATEWEQELGEFDDTP